MDMLVLNLDFKKSYVKPYLYPLSGRSMVINVEYNQLDPLLRASGYPDGDVNNETGFSPFPGNINQVIFCQIKYAAFLLPLYNISPFHFLCPLWK